MSDNARMESRVAALEAAVSELREQLANRPALNWFHQVSGIMQDNPAFDEVDKLGREMRDAMNSIEDKAD